MNAQPSYFTQYGASAVCFAAAWIRSTTVMISSLYIGSHIRHNHIMNSNVTFLLGAPLQGTLVIIHINLTSLKLESMGFFFSAAQSSAVYLCGITILVHSGVVTHGTQHYWILRRYPYSTHRIQLFNKFLTSDFCHSSCLVLYH